MCNECDIPTIAAEVSIANEIFIAYEVTIADIYDEVTIVDEDTVAEDDISDAPEAAIIESFIDLKPARIPNTSFNVRDETIQRPRIIPDE